MAEVGGLRHIGRFDGDPRATVSAGIIMGMGVWWPARSRLLCCPSQLWARKAKQAKFQNLNIDLFSLPGV